jgi:hypothetical protein
MLEAWELVSYSVKIFGLSIAFVATLGPNHPLIGWVPGALSLS